MHRTGSSHCSQECLLACLSSSFLPPFLPPYSAPFFPSLGTVSGPVILASEEAVLLRE